MENLNLLVRAYAYIEEHLDCDMKTEDIAEACFVSKSSLEKAFKLHFSVHDYITRRRMNKAGRLMIEKPELSILDIAVQYGYSSHEAFTRAFFQVWKCTPTEYRKRQNKKLHPLEFFPPITGFMQLEGENFMRRTVDLSELYDFIKERKNCWFVCCDIQYMIAINDISRTAGDLAILEAMKRMELCSGDDDVIFRIGGDEFVILTNSTQKSYAEEICKKLLSMNGEIIPFDKAKVPLNLYAIPVLVEQNVVRYDELFEKLQIRKELKIQQKKIDENSVE